MKKALFATLAVVMGLGMSAACAESLTVYSNWPRDAMDQLKDAFTAKYPSIDMTYYRAAGAELSTQFLSEEQMGTGKADYIISDVDFMELFKDRGYLMKYQPKDIARFNPDAVDPDGYWITLDFGPYVIVYNTQSVSKADAPKAWKDLLDPKWKNKIGMCDPRTSAGIQVPLTYWTKNLAARGKPYGWPFVEALGKQDPTLTSGHRQLSDLVVTGEVAIAAEMPVSFITPAIKNGEPIKIVWPEEGSPTSPNAGAIVAGTPHVDAAKKFHDYLASVEGQQFLADHWGTNPANRDVKFVTPDGKNLSDVTIKRVQIDPKDRKTNTEKFMSYMQ